MIESRKAFHEDLADLTTGIVRLGALAVEAVEAGTAALLDSDLAAVERVVADDRVLDDLTHDIEARTYLLLARQQPMAVDLRLLVTGLRVCHEIERVGDLMVKVAKATRRLYPRGLDPRTRGIVDRMREQAGVQLRVAVDAFADRDPARAAALVDMDDVMDNLQSRLFQAILGSSDDEDAVERAMQVALIGRYFERVGDHAANIAERVEFMVHGRRRSDEDDPETPNTRASQGLTTPETFELRGLGGSADMWLGAGVGPGFDLDQGAHG